MQQTYGDLTLSDVLNDPLILAVSHADGVSTAEFKTLLYSAAEKLGSKAAHRTTHYASVPTISGPKRKLHAMVNPCPFFRTINVLLPHVTETILQLKDRSNW